MRNMHPKTCGICDDFLNQDEEHECQIDGVTRYSKKRALRGEYGPEVQAEAEEAELKYKDTLDKEK